MGRTSENQEIFWLYRADGTEGVCRKSGSLEGQDLTDADYDIDECNDEIAEMYGVCP